mgnify:CR=1 FL=1
MKSVILFIFFLTCAFAFSQNESYLSTYNINTDSIIKLTFKDKKAFNNFILKFEDKKGFVLPKFLIIDETGKLLKHKLDILISECGKGDVSALKKRYFKKLPSLKELNLFFNEVIEIPEPENFIVVFIWHEAADKYNKHTFETYHTWKQNNNISFYFLELTLIHN